MGSGNQILSKTLCLHLPSLLPLRHAEIDISNLIQTSAFVGLGLLHCQTNHRLIIEFLLSELSKFPILEKSYNCREAMMLSIGWSLGMILLQYGTKHMSKHITNNNNNKSNNLSENISQNNEKTPNNNKINNENKNQNNNENEKHMDNGLMSLKIEDRLQILIDGGKRPSDSTIFPVS